MAAARGAEDRDRADRRVRAKAVSVATGTPYAMDPSDPDPPYDPDDTEARLRAIKSLHSVLAESFKLENSPIWGWLQLVQATSGAEMSSLLDTEVEAKLGFDADGLEARIVRLLRVAGPRVKMQLDLDANNLFAEEPVEEEEVESGDGGRAVVPPTPMGYPAYPSPAAASPGTPGKGDVFSADDDDDAGTPLGTPGDKRRRSVLDKGGATATAIQRTESLRKLRDALGTHSAMDSLLRELVLKHRLVAQWKAKNAPIFGVHLGSTVQGALAYITTLVGGSSEDVTETINGLLSKDTQASRWLAMAVGHQITLYSIAAHIKRPYGWSARGGSTYQQFGMARHTRVALTARMMTAVGNLKMALRQQGTAPTQRAITIGRGPPLDGGFSF